MSIGSRRASVISSALFGSVVASAIANTVSTGSLTIPTMKRLGYPEICAVAVEVVTCH
ncbi:TRAP transporter large permease subunit [Amorphus sp. MBR-141]